MNTVQNKKTEYQKVLFVLFISLFVTLTYTFLHEGGHALVGIFFGKRLTAFSFIDFSAHISIDGNLLPSQAIPFYLAGVCVPLLVWLVFILIAPKKSFLTIETLKLIASAMVLGTLLAWIVLPVLFLYGQAPQEEDVTNFLRNVGLPPLLVSGLALGMFFGGLYLLSRRIPDLRSELANFRKPDQELFTPAIWKAAGVLMILLLLYAGVGFAANGFRLSAPNRPPSYLPPSGYSLVKRIVLSEKEYTGEAVYTFNIEKTSTVGIYLLIQNINSPYFEVEVSGPGGYQKRMIHAEGYTANQDNPHMEEPLQAGTYRIILTSKISPGEFMIFLYK